MLQEQHDPLRARIKSDIAEYVQTLPPGDTLHLTVNYLLNLHGITQVEAAKRMNLKVSQLHRLLNGHFKTQQSSDRLNQIRQYTINPT